MGTDNRAGFWVRLAAYAIDRLILAVALLLVRVPALIAAAGSGGLKAVFFQFTWVDILCWLTVSAYFVLLTGFGGATLGKRALRLRVVRSDSGEKPTFLTVIYRETIGRYLSGILYIGYILAAVDESRQTLHDRICDTLVVYDESVPVRKQPAPPTRQLTVVPVEDPIRDWYAPYRK